MILIGTDAGIYRWFEGAGWPVFHGLQDRSVVGLAASGPGVLAVLDRSGDLLETTDNGENWRLIPTPEGAGRASVVAAGATSGLVLGVKPLGVYRRAFGAPVPTAATVSVGTGFRPRVLNTGRDLARRASARLAPQRRRASADPEAVRLAGWEPRQPPPALRATVGPSIRVLAVAPGAWFAAVTGAGLWVSGDAGGSWAKCPGLPAEVYSVRPVADRAGHVWAATESGCWVSTDSGATWEERSAGLENARHVRAIEVKPGAPDVLLAGAAPSAAAAAEGGTVSREGLNFALFESTNGGASWLHVKRSFPDRLEADSIADIRYDPAAPDNAVVALGSGELWVTRNDGAYWGPLARQIKAARALAATA